MTAITVLRDAANLGVTVRLVDGRPKVEGRPGSELLDCLRHAKDGILEILTGTRCRLCGVVMSRPSFGMVTYDDDSVEHGWCRRQEDLVNARGLPEQGDRR